MKTQRRRSWWPVRCRGLPWPALTSVLPEASCTELPRGRSLCPARGSSVQDASGWESAGSTEAFWPQHCTDQLLAGSTPGGVAALGQGKSRLRLSVFSKKQGRCLPSHQKCWLWASQHTSALACGSSDRIKLDMTPQQLKEVTVLTLALPGGPARLPG